MVSSNDSALQTDAAVEKIQVRFATNRVRVEDDRLFGSDFHQVPPLFVTGHIDVYHRGGHPNPNWDPCGKSLYIDPTAKAALSSIPEAVAAAPSADDAMTQFIGDLLKRGLEANKGKTNAGLVFLHGFNCSFISAMSSAAQIASAYGAQHVFCFSWPSQGEFGLNEYFKDRDSAYASGSAIALALSVVFSKLLGLKKAARPNLRIACHSMGNRALSAAIQHISMAAPQLLTEAYFSYALLMAADENNNALAEPTKLKALLTLADHIDVYTNESDLAMFLSSLANFKPPLGWSGPTDFKHLPSKVISIDCTDVGATYENNGSSDWGHQYFRNSHAVTADVHQVLQGIPPDKVSPRMPDRDYPKRKFVIPFDIGSPWARARGYRETTGEVSEHQHSV
jgi:esterase/lipase superfamily enzyme